MVRGRMDLSSIPVLREEEIVRHHQTGADGKCRVSAVCDFFQSAAARHAEKIGVGLTFLHRHGLAWVLSRLHIEIMRYPELDEKVDVITYPSGFERLFAIREFALVDGIGAEIVRASSAWLLVDTARLRPLRAAAELGGEGDEPNRELPRYFNVSGKLPLSASDGFEKFAGLQTMVLPSEIDLNRHMNNAVYIARMSDVLGGVRPREFDVVFQRSMTVGQSVEYSAWRRNEEFFVCGSCGDVNCFTAIGRM